MLCGIGVLASIGMKKTGSTIMPFLIVVIFGGKSGYYGSFKLNLLNLGYKLFNLRPWEVSAFGIVLANRPSEIGN